MTLASNDQRVQIIRTEMERLLRDFLHASLPGDRVQAEREYVRLELLLPSTR